jgi:hypothetical protein
VRPCFCSVTEVFRSKINVDEVFYAREIIRLFSVVFFVVRVVHKFDLGFVINRNTYAMKLYRLMFSKDRRREC